MIEYRTLVPPFEPAFTEPLQRLAIELFGDLDPNELVWRLTHMPDVSAHIAVASEHIAVASEHIAVASEHIAVASELVGFKLGFASARTRYDSWLGGVSPAWRRRGIALELMSMQHRWLAARGFNSVETAAVADNAAMLSLNLRVGFKVVGLYNRGNSPRVILAKELSR